MIFPRGLRAAAGPNPDPKGDDCEPDVELMSIQAVPEVNILFRHFLVYALAFEVPGSPSHDTRVYRGSEYYRHMSYSFLVPISAPRRLLIAIWPSFMTMTWLE